MATIRNVREVKRLMANAISFTEAARRIKGDELFLWPPFYVCLYYAIELSFKAFLSSRGHSLGDLKKIGHGLRDLSDACVMARFVYRDEAFSELINQIDGRLHDLRYLQGDSIEVVTADEALNLVDGNLRLISLEIPITDIHR